VSYSLHGQATIIHDANNIASARQDVVQSKTLTNGSSFEMGSLSAGVPTAPGFSHPHHHIIRREPVFVPALYNVRRAALAHAEQDLRSTYQKVQQVDYRMRQARTWPDQRVQDSSTGKIEDLQRERTELLDRLVDLVPRFGIAGPTASEDGTCS